MKWFTAILVVLAFVATSLTVAQQEKETKKADVKVAYSCPMHKDATSAKAGDCPKCGMKMEKSSATMGEKKECAEKHGMKKGGCCADSSAAKADCPKEKAK
jgi:hypothetical protein